MKKVTITVLKLIAWPVVVFVVLFPPAGRALDVIGNFFLGLNKKSDA